MDKQQLRELRANVEAVIEDDHEGEEMLAIMIVDRIIEPILSELSALKAARQRVEMICLQTKINGLKWRAEHGRYAGDLLEANDVLEALALDNPGDAEDTDQ